MLIAIGCLLVSAALPLMTTSGGGDWNRPVTGLAVQASPRMAFNIEQPVVLSRTPFLELERGKFSVQAGADGTADRRLVLEGAVLRLDAGRGADLMTTDVLSPLMMQLAGLGMDRILVRGATVRFSEQETGRVGPIDADLDLSARGPTTARGVAIFHGDALSFDIVAGRDAPLDGEARVGAARRPVTVSVKGENLGDVRFDGELSSRSGLAGDIEARLASPAALMRWLGAPVRQAAALRNVAMSGRARWVDGIFDLQDARVTLDGQRPATGALRVRHRAGRPIIEGTLAFAVLDLARLTAADDGAPPQPAAPPGPFGHTPSPLRPLMAASIRDLPAYLDVDADLRLSAATVLLRNGVRGRGAATITIDRGQLAAEFADIEWAGNKGRLHVEAGGQSWRPAFVVRGRVELLQAQDALAPVLPHGFIVGPATVTFDLRGRGDGADLMPGPMIGKVGVIAGAGARSAFDAFKIVERVAAKPTRDSALLSNAPQAMEAMDLRLQLTERSITVESGQLRSAGGTARLTGEIDRASSALDLVLVRTARARAPSRGNVPADTAEQSFALTGTWSAGNAMRLALP